MSSRLLGLATSALLAGSSMLLACDGAPAAQGPAGPAGVPGTPGTPGATGPQGPAGNGKALAFAPVKVATTVAEKQAAYASPSATVDGTTVPLAFETVLRSRQQLGAHVFGRVMTKAGVPVTNADGSEFISPSNDFSSLLEVGNRLFELTHFETTPAAVYLSELTQDGSGKLTATSTRPVDLSGVDGMWTPCAGSVSPWNTHLGSEEYPADARKFEAATSTSALSSAEKGMLRYWGLSTTSPIDQVKAAYDPYRYGYVVEIAVDGSATPTVRKHYAAGRRALELAYVMPDQRTVYLSDDGSNDGFYLFVAARAGDLSEGRLYAARWFQTSPAGQGGGRADLYWLPLGGSATDAEVKALIDGGIRFSDIFETEAQAADGTCPSAASGFRAIHTDSGGRECLRLRAGQELAASRLESRRYAAYVGATTEFRKTEGITYNPANHRLYVAFSDVNQGMVDNDAGKDLGGPNHIRLAQNDCGAVYELVISPNGELGSDYVAESAAALVEGQWLKAPGASTYPVGSPYYDATFTLPGATSPVANVCSVNGIANPDNLSFISGYDTLLIGEDTTDGHQNDVVWAYNVVTRELTRIFSTPYGSETTGVYWYANVNGHGYIKAQIQHPYGESDIEKAPTDAARESYTGYIGPFPAMN